MVHIPARPYADSSKELADAWNLYCLAHVVPFLADSTYPSTLEYVKHQHGKECEAPYYVLENKTTGKLFEWNE